MAVVDEATIRSKLRAFICTDLLRNAAYPLRDDEPLVSGGLVDSLALARLGVFVEQDLGVYLADTELTVENLDTLDKMVNLVLARSRTT